MTVLKIFGDLNMSQALASRYTLAVGNCLGFGFWDLGFSEDAG